MSGLRTKFRLYASCSLGKYLSITDANGVGWGCFRDELEEALYLFEEIRKTEGYHFAQLFSQHVTPLSIVKLEGETPGIEGLWDMEKGFLPSRGLVMDLQGELRGYPPVRVSIGVDHGQQAYDFLCRWDQERCLTLFKPGVLRG